MTNREISNEDYEYVVIIWKTLRMKIMKDYHDFYIKNDVLLLATVFKSFRIKSKNSFELDSVHYFSSPGYI